MSRFLCSLILTGLFVTAPALSAVEVRGVNFPERHEVANQPLQLNGAGVRVKFIVDVYAASLYLPHKEQTADAALAQPGAKSVQAVMLRDVSPDDFISAMINGFKDNNSAAQVGRYLPVLNDLGARMAAAGTAKKGTTMRIDYIPGTGTRITVDGQRQIADIPGDEFYQCLLRIWLGPKPVDASLKAALLGGK